MPVNKKVYKIVIAAPSDVSQEIEIAEKYINTLNHLDKPNNVGFDCYNWSFDSYAALHQKGPQGQIDEQLKISEADIFIAVFNIRFGTPTLGFDSGTEHELNQAIKAWEKQGTPEVKIFFKEVNPEDIVRLSEPEKQQYDLVKRLKEKMYSKGIVRRYKDLYPSENNHESFHELFIEELYRYRITKVSQINILEDAIKGTAHFSLKTITTNMYNPKDVPMDIGITEYLAVILRVTLFDRTQIFRFYFQFATDQNEIKWVGYTNLFPNEFIAARENSQGMDFSNSTGIFIHENILNTIRKRYPELKGKPQKIIRVRFRGDKQIERDIIFHYGFAEPLTVIE